MNAATKTARNDKQTQPDNTRRDELILEHMQLVKAIASNVQKTLGVHVEVDDLVHAGTMGLFDAATKYQDDKEVAFPAYAKHRIRGAILDSLRQLDWASRGARRQYRQMQTVTHELTAKLDRAPTHAEIADAMGIDAQRWQTLMIDFRSFGLAAARQRSAEREDGVVREIPSSPAKGPDQVFAKSEMRQKLNSAMQQLPERHKQVVKLYYEADTSMREIGNMLGVKESRISQIHKSALAKMQIILSGSGVFSTAAFC